MLSISENILLFVAGFGILQGILLSFLIYFHPKSDRSVNKFLAPYIACLTIIMSGPLFLQFISWRDSFFIAPFPLLAGPLLYLYIRSFKETVTWRKAFPHFVLFILYFFAAYWWLSDLNHKYPGADDFPKEGFRSPLSLAYFLIRYIQLVVYYFLARRELAAYQRSIQHVFSETSRINMRWAKWLINGFLLLVIISVVIFALMSKYAENFYLLYLINIAVNTPYIYMVTIKGVTQPTIWQNKSNEDKAVLKEQLSQTNEIAANGTKPPTSKPTLDIDRIEEIKSKIISSMDNDKLYQEPELTLQHLSDKLKFPPYQVSQAINEGMKKKFYDLVNGYRVEEAKRILSNPQSRNYTILSVGFEAGFNSKTTFNTVFKKFTGLTPTEFRDREKMATSYA